MKINLLAFGITRDIVGGSEFQFDLAEGATVSELKARLGEQYPPLARLQSLAIAVNGEYAGEEVALKATDEIVLIPPVSGG